MPVKGRVPVVAVSATASGALATAPRTPPAGCFSALAFSAAGAGEKAPATPPTGAWPPAAVDCETWDDCVLCDVAEVCVDCVFVVLSLEVTFTVAQFSPETVRVTVRVSYIGSSSACLPFMCADFSLGLMTTNGFDLEPV